MYSDHSMIGVISSNKLKRPPSEPEIIDLDGRFNGLGTSTWATMCRTRDVSTLLLVHDMCTPIKSVKQPLRGQNYRLGSRQLL